MAKLVVVCSCGQQSRVPYSALGRIGLCPGCGGTVRITKSNTRPEDKGPRIAPTSVRPAWTQSKTAPSADAIERFGRGVDLYNQGRYGEALAVFNALAEEMPDTPEVEQARNHCVAALRRPRLAQSATTERNVAPDDLTEAEVRRVILEKMRSGASDADRLQLDAARLAAEVLGLIGRPPSADRAVSSAEPHATDQRPHGPSRNGGAHDAAPSADPAPTDDAANAPSRD